VPVQIRLGLPTGSLAQIVEHRTFNPVTTGQYRQDPPMLRFLPYLSPYVQEGIDAYQKGERLWNNPYYCDPYDYTERRNAWFNGWNMASEMRLQKYDT
jgi:ribosome modulation factor